MFYEVVQVRGTGFILPNNSIFFSFFAFTLFASKETAASSLSAFAPAPSAASPPSCLVCYRCIPVFHVERGLLFLAPLKLVSISSRFIYD